MRESKFWRECANSFDASCRGSLASSAVPVTYRVNLLTASASVHSRSQTGTATTITSPYRALAGQQIGEAVAVQRICGKDSISEALLKVLYRRQAIC